MGYIIGMFIERVSFFDQDYETHGNLSHPSLYDISRMY